MSLLTKLKLLNPLRIITLEEDAQLRIDMATRIIKQSDATIRRANYIKHMAAMELKAATTWLREQKENYDE